MTLVISHLDAVRLSLEGIHQFLLALAEPAVVGVAFAGAAFVGGITVEADLVPALNRRRYSTPVAVLASLTLCPLRTVIACFAPANTPPTALIRIAFRV